MEIWKDIKNYPGYQVSSEGRVRTNNKVTASARFPERHWANRILKQKPRKDGRNAVELWRGKEHNTLLVHRLVAEAFIGEPSDPEMTVNHIDGNPANNCVTNLEWMTRADNIRDAFNRGVMSATHVTLTDGVHHFDFMSLAEGSRFLNKSPGYLSSILKRGCHVAEGHGVLYEVTI
jgi:hypothetical protein